MSKVKSVEGIRGIACFMVVLSHLSLTFFPYLHAFTGEAGVDNPIQGWIYNSPFGFIYSGTSAVYIFFVLSGYILTYVALKGDVHKIIVMSVKRYPRLMIPAVVSCIFAYILFHFSVEKSILTKWISNYGSFDYSFINAIYSGIIESFLRGKSQYNPVLWTMKIELVGSFIVFIMCFLRHKYSTIRIDLSIIMVIFFLTAFKILSASLGMGLTAFTVGYLFYLYGKNTNFLISISLFVFGLYLAGSHNGSLSYSALVSVLGQKTYSLGNFLSGIIIVYSVIFNSHLNTFFSKKLFVFMGKVSFSVYLIHLPIISTLGVVFFNLFYEYFSYENSAILASIFTIFSIYVISIFYYRYVDYKGMVFSNKIQSYLLNTVIKKNS